MVEHRKELIISIALGSCMGAMLVATQGVRRGLLPRSLLPPQQCPGANLLCGDTSAASLRGSI